LLISLVGPKKMFREYFYSPIGVLEIQANSACVFKIALVKPSLENENSNVITQQCKAQLQEYFFGKRRNFTLPLQLGGTRFQAKVWCELRKIPYGMTCSYSDISYSIGNPKAQRAVGLANKANALPIIVPCHRVIGKNGYPSGYAMGLEVKDFLLDLEQKGINGGCSKAL
jgi:methylated-DNA-[protein]-cysteine S-methyltransferase